MKAAIRLPGSCPPITCPVVGAAKARNHPLAYDTKVTDVDVDKPSLEVIHTGNDIITPGTCPELQV